MRRLSLGNPFSPTDTAWAIKALKTIEQASLEDIETVADEYTITGTVTETREFDNDTGTVSEFMAFFLTYMLDIQKRGSRRTDGG